MRNLYTLENTFEKNRGASEVRKINPIVFFRYFLLLTIMIGLPLGVSAQSISIVTSAYCPGGNITITANQPDNINGNVSYTVEVVTAKTASATGLQMLVSGNVFSTKQNAPTATYTATFNTTLNYNGTLYLRAIPNNAGGSLPAVYSEPFTLVASPPSPAAGASTTTSYVYGDHVAGKTLSVTPLADQTVNWYTVATGGTAVATNTSSYTPTVTNVGTYKYYAEAAGAGCRSTTRTEMTLVITARPLTVTATAANKVYDGNATASVNLTSDKLSTDALTFSFTSANFVNKNVGNGKTVTVSGISFSGTNAGNYTLSNTTATTTANITPRSLTVAISASGKVYDGLPISSATVTSNKLTNDIITINYSGPSFGNKNVGTKNIGITGISISGGDAGNYSLASTTASTTASITRKAITLSTPAAQNKVYDRTTAAVVTGTLAGIVSGDLVTFAGTGTFASANVGAAIAVIASTTLGGTDGNNYTLTVPTLSANITQKPLSVTGITATSKEYDGNATCVITGATLQGVISGDLVSLDNSGVTGAFNNANVGTGKTVSLSGAYSISGTSMANYSLPQPITTLTADITRKTLTISGVTGEGRVYDGTTVCRLIGSAVLEGVVPADAGKVTLAGVTAATAAFTDKNVGVGKIATVSGYSLSGDATLLGNYLLEVFSPKADITPKPLKVDVISENKTNSNGDPIVSLFTTDVVKNDVVNLTYASAKYKTDPNTNYRSIDVTGIAISGTDAANYSLTTTDAMGLNPLPVTLVSFTSKATSSGVTLNWSTATEKDNAYFSVERSLDGKTFSVIGKVTGNGNSSTLRKYQFVDGQGVKGVVYYRLKQVDYDGKFEYSKVIAVNAQAGIMALGQVKAYPNPTFTGKLALEAGRGQGGSATITILNGNGQMLSSQEVVLVEGQPHEIDMTQQKAGMYYVQVTNAVGNTTLRIAKQ